MGCERGKGGSATAMRSSMERRRVSNAKVTSLRQRKYQELTMQIEQENLQRAKEILERRKSERDRLNAYIHSVGDPQAKHSEHFRGMRRPNTEGMFGRPPWTASLRNDYETLIKLREKEIAVATLRLKNHKQLPNHILMDSEARGIDDASGRDESSFLNNEFEFHHNDLEPERFDSNHKNNGRNNNLDSERFADIGTNLLMLEPTVFREHSSNGPRSGAKALPPPVPTSNTRTPTPSLKSCLKSNKNNQTSSSLLSESPRAFPQESSERTSPYETPKMETTLCERQTSVKATTHTKMKTMTNLFLDPDMFSWGGHEDMNTAEELKDVTWTLIRRTDALQDPSEEGPKGRPRPARERNILEQLFSMPNFSAEENAEPVILRPTLECEVPENMYCSAINTPKQSDTHNDPPLEIAKAAASTLPPRYTSTVESWQEDKSVAPSLPDESPASPLLSPHEDKTCESEEESFITSIDSDAATSRLIAEVIAVQSRLEDCKLKPLDFRNMFADPENHLDGSLKPELTLTQDNPSVMRPTPEEEDQGLIRPQRKPLDFRNMFADNQNPCDGFEQHRNLRPELTTAEGDTSVMRPLPEEEDHELIRRQKKQGTIEVTMRAHEIFMREDEDTRPSLLDDSARKEVKTAENAANAVGASSVNDHDKEVFTTSHCSTDNSTQMHTFEGMESRKRLQATAWEIPWKNDVGQQRRHVEEPRAVNTGSSTINTGSSTVNTGSSTVKNVVMAPFPCTITKPPKPVGVTIATDKIKQPRILTDQQPQTRNVQLQTDDELKQLGEPMLKQPGGSTLKQPGEPMLKQPGGSTLKQPGETTRSEGNSTPRVERPESTAPGSDCSLTSTSRYLNIGYRDLSGAPRPKFTKQHCFYSSHGSLQVGYSQPKPSVKQNIPRGQPCGFHDSLGDKENYGSDDQELSILASLERLDWKLAAISARAMNRTSITPSMVSQNQASIQSAPAATGVKPASTEGTPRKIPVHPLRPSSVRTQKPPTRNFRQRRIVGVTNKFHQDIYNC